MAPRRAPRRGEPGCPAHPELSPTLVRWAPPPDAPPHLRIGIRRLEQAERGETVLVVGTEMAPAPLLERVSDARKHATVLALDQGDPELEQLAHEVLTVQPGTAPVSFDGAQHLVSSAAGGAGRADPARAPAMAQPGARHRQRPRPRPLRSTPPAPRPEPRLGLSSTFPRDVRQAACPVATPA